jgi:hypothetical protein
MSNSLNLEELDEHGDLRVESSRPAESRSSVATSAIRDGDLLGRSELGGEVGDESKQTPEGDYEVTLTSVDKLTPAEIATCIDVVVEGEAVPRWAAETGVPRLRLYIRM